MKRLVHFLLVVFFLVLLGGGAAVLATQYLFQEPAQVTWSRYLVPEFLWQRQKYPSARWAFDLVEPLIHREDTRTRFVRFSDGPALNGPASWSNDQVGPQLSGLPALLAAPRETIKAMKTEDLLSALRQAQPGTVIELLPGVYDFSGTKLTANIPGKSELPIVVRAAELGSVRLRFSLLEGFHVLAPHWAFENLVIEGTCRRDSRCEHAFHVVGNATGTVIRNNWVMNFNAAVKVNGKDGVFPDNGLITHNAFINGRPRDTDKPVAVLDFVGPSGWRVRWNVIADFAKAGGNHTSYGAFFKGAGENNVFEQNLVRCEWAHGGGARIGFSFGDGGTGRRFCRDAGQCKAEHRNGIARNNVIMNCPNEVGIYVYKSTGTVIHNNALINTRGIDLRHTASDASIVNNVIDGRILARDGARFSADANILSRLKAALLSNVSKEIYADVANGDLRLADQNALVGRGVAIDGEVSDLCGQPYRQAAPDIGPIQYHLDLACRPVLD